MSFLCPKCQEKMLKVSFLQDLGADDKSDERNLQQFRCQNCQFSGLALYEASSRGASESFHHWGYYDTADLSTPLPTDIPTFLTTKQSFEIHY